jgi:beta-lactamase class A
VLLPLLLGLAAQAAPANQPAPAPLAARVERAAASPWASLQRDLTSIAALPVGELGVAVVDPASGQSASVNGDRPFPMASTVKVAIAATYLADVDQGRRNLADLIPLDERLRLRAEGINQFAPHPGVVLSAANLIELMLTRSDNTATDVLLQRLGGPPAIEAWLVRNRIAGLRVDRTIGQQLLDRIGATPAPGQTAAEAMRAFEPVAPGSVDPADAEHDEAMARFDRDVRDTATPLGFAELLRRLDRGDLLKPASRTFLLEVMGRCLTGANRIKGNLPAGTLVRHKTGTWNTVTNDVGIVTLPDGRRLIVVAFASGGSNRAALIARAARAAFDAFVPSR